MTIFLQYTISFMLLSMVIAASYYGLDDYQPDNDDGDAPNVKREKGGCKYPGRACSAGGWYSYGCYFSHMLPGGLKVVSIIGVLFYARAGNSKLAKHLIVLNVSFTATKSKFTQLATLANVQKNQTLTHHNNLEVWKRKIFQCSIANLYKTSWE